MSSLDGSTYVQLLTKNKYFSGQSDAGGHADSMNMQLYCLMSYLKQSIILILN